MLQEILTGPAVFAIWRLCARGPRGRLVTSMEGLTGGVVLLSASNALVCMMHGAPSDCSLKLGSYYDIL